MLELSECGECYKCRVWQRGAADLTHDEIWQLEGQKPAVCPETVNAWGRVWELQGGHEGEMQKQGNQRVVEKAARRRLRIKGWVGTEGGHARDSKPEMTASRGRDGKPGRDQKSRRASRGWGGKLGTGLQAGDSKPGSAEGAL